MKILTVLLFCRKGDEVELINGKYPLLAREVVRIKFFYDHRCQAECITVGSGSIRQGNVSVWTVVYKKLHWPFFLHRLFEKMRHKSRKKHKRRR